MPRRIARWSAIAAVAVSACAPTVVAPSAFGQTPPGKGLDGLNEGDVRASMAEFGLTDLFDRDCDVNKIPADQRGAALALVQLQRLANAGNLTVARRRALAVEVAKGLQELLPNENDPKRVDDQALELMNGGVVPAQNEIEYFGENPAALDALHTVADVDRNMFTHVVDTVGKAAGALANQLAKAPAAQQPPLLAKLRETRPLKVGATYYAGLLAYDVALGVPKGNPDRAATAKAGIEALKKFDNADMGVQPVVHLQIGKLMLTAGDTAGAKAAFADVVAGKVAPAPAAAQQFDARYFTVAADLDAGDRAAAEKDFADLQTWVTTTFLPGLPQGGQDDVTAACTMLQFRLTSAQADAAGSPAEKQKLNADAINLVSGLLKSQPWRSDLVFDQMIARVPETADPATLDTLVLLGLQNQGFQEYTRWEAGGEKGTADAKVTDRALAAAAELVKRKGQPGVTDETAARSAYFLGYGRLSLGREKEAAAAFMDYAEHDQADMAAAQDALDHAEALVGKLRKEQKADGGTPDEETRQLYDRFLPLAINAPYNEKRFAYDYGQTLRDERKYADAAAAFGQIPAADKLYAPAQVLTVLSLSDELTDAGQAVSADQRKAAAEQLQAVAPDVAKRAEAAAASGAGEAKQRALLQVANVLYRAAVSARRDLKDPAKALTWLDGYEGKIKGATNGKGESIEPAFDQYATTLRVNCLMDLGKVGEATQVLVPMLNKDPVAAGGQLLDLLQQVGRDLAAAKAARDVAGERQLAQNQAQLSGFLVTFAERSSVPAVKNNLNQYRLFDATSKRQAAELATDPAAKTADLKAALGQYEPLAKLPATKENDAMIDPAKLGVGLTQFDLADYPEAKAYLSDLLKRNRVGTAFTTDAAGANVENPQYWETAYKLIKSIDEVAKKNPGNAQAKTDLAEAVNFLKLTFVTYGDKTGGTGYKDEFTQLRTELAPDMKLK